MHSSPHVDPNKYGRFLWGYLYTHAPGPHELPLVRLGEGERNQKGKNPQGCCGGPFIPVNLAR